MYVGRYFEISAVGSLLLCVNGRCTAALLIQSKIKIGNQQRNKNVFLEGSFEKV